MQHQKFGGKQDRIRIWLRKKKKWEKFQNAKEENNTHPCWFPTWHQIVPLFQGLYTRRGVYPWHTPGGQAARWHRWVKPAHAAVIMKSFASETISMSCQTSRRLGALVCFHRVPCYNPFCWPPLDSKPCMGASPEELIPIAFWEESTFACSLVQCVVLWLWKILEAHDLQGTVAAPTSN